MTAGAWMGLVALGVLASAAPAAALCQCGDLPSGCGSALSCTGSSPGDACSPPKNATCKIREGLGTQLVCCCGCTKGPGPVSCAYGPVTAQMPALRAGAAVCNETKVQGLADKAVPKAERALQKAEDACDAGKDAAAKAARATKGLGRLKTKIEKLEDRGKIAPGCASTYGALIDQYVTAIDRVETEGDPGTFGGTTTTTAAGTTTTTLGGLTKNCSGAFTPFLGDVNEVDFTFFCTGQTSGKTGFAIWSSGRDVTNYLQPSGFTCSIQPMGGDDALDCAPLGGTFDSATERVGRLRFSPAPAAGMGGWMNVREGATTRGPFALIGP